jgi:broad specificity phosphatase PhoE
MSRWSDDAPVTLVLVKHALPVLDASKPAREWRLGMEGDRQAQKLAGALRTFAPLRMIASPEPKAASTAAIVAAELGVDVSVIDALREFDRPVLPHLSKEEHAHTNEQIFVDLNRRVLGTESGREALDRFSVAIDDAIAQTSAQSLVAVTHGTVMSLFVAARNAIDGFTLWKQLECTSYVVLDVPSFALRNVVLDASNA